MPLELTAADSTRQSIEQLRAQRLDQLRFDRAELDRQRIEQQRAEAARSSRELAEQAAAESIRSEFQSNRVERSADTNLERLRGEDVLAERQTDRFLSERARVEAPLAYAAQAPRVEAFAQADRLQAERIQATRDSIERADSSRIDRILLSDQAIAQVQFAY